MGVCMRMRMMDVGADVDADEDADVGADVDEDVDDGVACAKCLCIDCAKLFQQRAAACCLYQMTLS